MAQHRGKHVYGKGRHRDAVRSSHSHTVWKWGHKWGSLAILVPIPFIRRGWALPVLSVLYRPADLNRAEGRRHRTPPALVRQMMAALLHWFPQRKFILLADGNFATHELARFCRRHGRHVTFVSRYYATANLCEPPPPYGGKGRPRVKGAKLPAPQEVVAACGRLRRALVRWYGGQQRRIGSVSSTGHGYKGGAGLVPVRWVLVRDRQGTHRDDYFFTTALTLAPEQVVGWYTQRWSLEKAQGDYPSRSRWGRARRVGYHRRSGVARVGRVVPATPGHSHRRSRLSDTTRRPHPPTLQGEQATARVGASAGQPTEAPPRTPRPTARGQRPQGGRPRVNPFSPPGSAPGTSTVPWPGTRLRSMARGGRRRRRAWGRLPCRAWGRRRGRAA